MAFRELFQLILILFTRKCMAHRRRLKKSKVHNCFTQQTVGSTETDLGTPLLWAFWNSWARNFSSKKVVAAHPARRTRSNYANTTTLSCSDLRPRLIRILEYSRRWFFKTAHCISDELEEIRSLANLFQLVGRSRSAPTRTRRRQSFASDEKSTATWQELSS